MRWDGGGVLGLAAAGGLVGPAALRGPSDRPVEERHDLRQPAAEHAAVIEVVERRVRAAAAEDLQQFDVEPRPARLLDLGGTGVDRLREARFQGSTEACGEVHRADHPDGVLLQPRGRVAERADRACLEVREPVHVVDDGVGDGVIEEGVHREVAPPRVLGGRPEHVVVVDGAVGTVHGAAGGAGVGTERGRLDHLVAREPDVDEAEAAPDDEGGAEDALDPARRARRSRRRSPSARGRGGRRGRSRRRGTPRGPSAAGASRRRRHRRRGPHGGCGRPAGTTTGSRSQARVGVGGMAAGGAPARSSGGRVPSSGRGRSIRAIRTIVRTDGPASRSVPRAPRRRGAPGPARRILGAPRRCRWPGVVPRPRGCSRWRSAAVPACRTCRRPRRLDGRGATPGDVRRKADEALAAGKFEEAWNLEAQPAPTAPASRRSRSRPLAADKGAYEEMFPALRKKFGGLSTEARAKVDALAGEREAAGQFDDAVDLQIVAADDAPAYEAAWAVYKRAPVKDALEVLERIEAAAKAEPAAGPRRRGARSERARVGVAVAGLRRVGAQPRPRARVAAGRAAAPRRGPGRRPSRGGRRPRARRDRLARPRARARRPARPRGRDRVAEPDTRAARARGARRRQTRARREAARAERGRGGGPRRPGLACRKGARRRAPAAPSPRRQAPARARAARRPRRDPLPVRAAHEPRPHPQRRERVVEPRTPRRERDGAPARRLARGGLGARRRLRAAGARGRRVPDAAVPQGRPWPTCTCRGSTRTRCGG